MKGLQFMNSAGVYIEIGQTSLKVLHGDSGLELPLDRAANGRLTEASKERLALSLQGFLKHKSWQPRLRALCAIGARGIALRRLTLPASTEDLSRLLRLQIEAEFPLSPDELAWGYRQIGGVDKPRNGAGQRQDVLVAAVKKDLIEEYSAILSACGLNAVFTLAAVARSSVCPKPAGSYAMLDIGRSQSELASFEHGAPSSLRILPWGGEDITRAIQEKLGISRDEAENLKIKLDQEPTSDGERGQKIHSALGSAVDLLAESLRGDWAGQKLYLTGRSALYKDLVPRLARQLGVECERIELMPGAARSAAILGLKRSVEQSGAVAPLVLKLNEAKNGEAVARPALWKWAALVVLLVIGSLTFPYAEAFLLKPRLSRQLTAIKVDLGRLPIIDRELNFLEYLKRNQSPYLDTVYLIAKAAPSGARLDSLAMNRHGEISLRGSMQNSQQVTEFRSKLIESGLFSTVTVEEQSPTPDRQKVAVRMTAQWKPASAREGLSFDPPANELDKPGAKPAKSGASPDHDASPAATSKASSQRKEPAASGKPGGTE